MTTAAALTHSSHDNLINKYLTFKKSQIFISIILVHKYISAYEYLCKHHESRSAAFMYEPAIQDKVWIRVKESQMNAATVSLTNFPSNWYFPHDESAPQGHHNMMHCKISQTHMGHMWHPAYKLALVCTRAKLTD